MRHRRAGAVCIGLLLGVFGSTSATLAEEVAGGSAEEASAIEEERQRLEEEIQGMESHLRDLEKRLDAAIQEQNGPLVSEIEQVMAGVKADLAGTYEALQSLPPPPEDDPPPEPDPGDADPVPDDPVDDDPIEDPPPEDDDPGDQDPSSGSDPTTGDDPGPGEDPGGGVGPGQGDGLDPQDGDPGEEPGDQEPGGKPRWPRPGEPFRVRVRLGGREFYANSATRTLGEARGGHLRAPSGARTMAKLLRRLPEGNPVTSLRPERDANGAGLAKPLEPGRPAVPGDLSSHVESETLPAAESSFLDRLEAVLPGTPPERIRGIWAWFRRENDDLPPEVRFENALMRYVLATGETLAEATPDEVHEEDVENQTGQLEVRGPRSVLLREVPWGDKVSEVAPGARVELVGPRRGAWLRVRTSQEEGFLPEMWLEDP